MSIQVRSDSTTHHEFIVRKRNLIVQRLVRVLDALDRKRHVVTEVVSDVASFLPGSSSSSSASSSSTALSTTAGPATRNAVIGAVAGGAVFALGLLFEHRRRERNRPLRVLQRAWFKYAIPPQPSLLTRLVTEAVGSLVLSVVQEAARSGVQKLLDARTSSDDGPVVLTRVSDSPDPSFVTEPVTVDPGVMHPREAMIAPAGIAPPDPISPLPTPFREFT